ncbi:MAG: xanthine dehydrogenase small subunit [Pirellulales bacterium]
MGTTLQISGSVVLRAAAMRHHLIVWVNGVRRVVDGGDAFLTLSDYLRGRLGLVGTKIVCSEGDCGACTVLVADPADGQGGRFRPVDSCIRFLFQLDGCHVVSIEGLAHDGELSPVQQAMVECHGSQCGYCTPGFVMTMAGACHASAAPATSDDTGLDWRRELAGNLCRCTGYVSIFEAGQQAAAAAAADWLAMRFPDISWAAEGRQLRGETLDLAVDLDGAERRVVSPASLAEAVGHRQRMPDARVVAGATDLGVLWNKGRLRPQPWLDISRVAELRGLEIAETPGGPVLVAGALATWTDFLAACRTACTEFVPILEAFGGPQIRHVGTVGGNIVNGSPIADSLPLLCAMDATLELASAAGTRTVGINGFFLGYKQLDLRPDELLLRVRMPLPAAGEILRLTKVSRRRDLDISTFTSAVRIGMAGDRIGSAAVAYGGVAPTVIRLRGTEAFLIGRPFTEETFRLAGERAVAEIAPLSDVRGSGDYRRQLARNVLRKFFHEQAVATS